MDRPAPIRPTLRRWKRNLLETGNNCPRLRSGSSVISENYAALVKNFYQQFIKSTKQASRAINIPIIPYRILKELHSYYPYKIQKLLILSRRDRKMALISKNALDQPFGPTEYCSKILFSNEYYF